MACGGARPHDVTWCRSLPRSPPDLESAMNITGSSLSADGIRAFLQSKKDEEAAKQRALEAEARAGREAPARAIGGTKKWDRPRERWAVVFP